MKAHALTQFGASSLDIIDLPDPVVQPGQVLVRNHAAGVNSVDHFIRIGMLPPAATPLPYVLGVEGAGVVETVAPEVSDLEAGDRVMWLGQLGAGAYGPLSAVDASYVVKIGDAVSFEQAAASAAAYATAHNVLFTYGAPEPGSWVLIHSAAGGVGLAALQLARNAGYKTIGLTTAGKLDFVRQQGADAAIDRTAPDVVDQIRAATGNRGVAQTLNSVAGDTLVQDMEVLAPFGQVITFGRLGGPPAGSAHELLSPYFPKNAGIRTSDLFALARERKDAFHAILRKVADDLANRRIVPEIAATFPVAEAVAAHELLSSGMARGKLILTHGG